MTVTPVVKIAATVAFRISRAGPRRHHRRTHHRRNGPIWEHRKGPRPGLTHAADSGSYRGPEIH